MQKLKEEKEREEFLKKQQQAREMRRHKLNIAGGTPENNIITSPSDNLAEKTQPAQVPSS